jgi:hypothetical protein
MAYFEWDSSICSVPTRLPRRYQALIFSYKRPDCALVSPAVRSRESRRHDQNLLPNSKRPAGLLHRLRRPPSSYTNHPPLLTRKVEVSTLRHQERLHYITQNGRAKKELLSGIRRLNDLRQPSGCERLDRDNAAMRSRLKQAKRNARALGLPAFN